MRFICPRLTLISKLEVEDLQGRDCSGFGCYHFLHHLFIELELRGRVIGREFVKRVFRLVHQRVVVGSRNFANAFLNLKVDKETVELSAISHSIVQMFSSTLVQLFKNQGFNLVEMANLHVILFQS